MSKNENCFRIKSALASHSYGNSFSKIDVASKLSQVKLTGIVKSFYLLQVAQELVKKNLPEGCTMLNEIRVG